MNINTMLKTLGVSKLKAAWALLTGGVSGLLTILAKAFTALLHKADSSKLRQYVDLSVKLAKFIRYGVELFVINECYKKAGIATANALTALAEHVSDGEYTKAELDDDINTIEACISLWKEAPKCEKEQ